MSRYKAVAGVTVAGNTVAAGDTFEADDAAVSEAVRFGLIEPVEDEPTPAEPAGPPVEPSKADPKPAPRRR